MQTCMYTVQGELVCPNSNKKMSVLENFQPAYVSVESKRDSRAQRSANGSPYPSTEREIKGYEKHGKAMTVDNFCNDAQGNCK